MNRNHLTTAALAALLAGALAACRDATDPVALVSDAEVTADIAAASGEAIANDVAELILNESSAGLPAAAPSFSLFGSPPGVTVTRTRTCYDASHVAQAQCDPTTTASIEFTMTMDGSFTRSHTGPRGSESLTQAVHRARALTVSGLEGQETSRTHDGTGTSRDTTAFEGSHEGVTLSRTLATASDDTVAAVVFDLPRATNPWPVSGSIIRNVSGTATIASTGGPNGDRSETRTFARRVVVTFPADAQGNVTLTINDKTCTLNLVTREVVCPE